MDNVLNSWDGPFSGFCLPYSNKVHLKQLWLKNYMWYLSNYLFI